MWRLRPTRSARASFRAGVNAGQQMMRFCAAKSSVGYPSEHQALIPPPAAGNGHEVKTWMDQHTTNTSLPEDRRIYCNRTIDLGKIEAIGFDMVRIRSIAWLRALSMSLGCSRACLKRFPHRSKLCQRRNACPHSFLLESTSVTIAACSGCC
jgi:hypothetical protein